MAAIYTHTPGGKPAPGFTFGIDRLLLCPATMSPGSTGWKDGLTRTGKAVKPDGA